MREKHESRSAEPGWAQEAGVRVDGDRARPRLRWRQSRRVHRHSSQRRRGACV